MAYTTQYIGSRYVPMFADPMEWNSTRTYEPLTIVLHEGNSFTSRQFVPVGIDINNDDYWGETGNYNAQIEAYRREVLSFASRIGNLENLSSMLVIGATNSDTINKLFETYDIIIIKTNLSLINPIVIPSHKTLINLATISSIGTCVSFGGQYGKFLNMGTIQGVNGLAFGIHSTCFKNEVTNNGLIKGTNAGILFDDNYASYYNDIAGGCVFSDKGYSLLANLNANYVNENHFYNIWFQSSGIDCIHLQSNNKNCEITDNVFEQCSMEPVSSGQYTGHAISLTKALRNQFIMPRIEEVPISHILEMSKDVTSTYIKTTKRFPISIFDNLTFNAYPAIIIEAPIIDTQGNTICYQLACSIQYFDEIGNIKNFKILDYNPTKYLFVYNTTATPVTAHVSNYGTSGNNQAPVTNVIHFDNVNAKDNATLNNFYGINGTAEVLIYCATPKGCTVTDAFGETVIDVDEAGIWLCVCTNSTNSYTSKPVWRKLRIDEIQN